MNLRKLSENFGVEWTCEHIVPKIVEMHNDATYLQRLTALHAVTSISMALNSESVQEVMIPIAITLAQVLYSLYQ